mmetsp:Transcript_5401/g.8509  ORF Transcript_5401/g.8509 Transcript_5401/m.8509 type:complete len:383 (-) Transcript_5401:650-1798(-)
MITLNNNTTLKKNLPSRFQQMSYIVLGVVTVVLVVEATVFVFGIGSLSSIFYSYDGGNFFQTQKVNELIVPSSNFCRIQDLKIGHWVNITYDLPPYTPMRGEVQQKTCPDFKQNQPFRTWIWEPEAVRSTRCIFKKFEEESYCRLMENKTVAIIGDSVSFDHFLSLSHLLGVPQALPRAMRKDALLTSQVCNKDKYNSSSSSSTLIGKRDFYLHSVKDIVRDHFPDVLVLNRGAHYVPNDELLRHINDTLFPQLNDWQARCKLKKKDCLLIWRTTVPGHPNCSQFTRPSKSVEEMEQLIARANTNLAYHYDEFSVQNELVLNAFQIQKRTANLSYEVMDAYHVNILRPDMHPSKNDCLHTCLPKDNTYSWLLNHMLHVKYSQ